MVVAYAVQNPLVLALLTARDMSATLKIASELKKDGQEKFVMPVSY